MFIAFSSNFSQRASRSITNSFYQLNQFDISFTMNSVDPRHRLRANGAEPINDACYINAYIPRSSWSKEIIYRGFDLTPDEYLAANTQLMILFKYE
jgi:hypothetical protein